MAWSWVFEWLQIFRDIESSSSYLECMFSRAKVTPSVMLWAKNALMGWKPTHRTIKWILKYSYQWSIGMGSKSQPNPCHGPIQDIHLWERDVRSCILKLTFMNESIMIARGSRVQGLTRAWLPGLVVAFFWALCTGALGRSVLKCFNAGL